jgi:hypothetical protein
MPDDAPSQQEKTLEMRLAELEDKLSKLHITEEELKAYQKVASLLGAVPGTGAGVSTAFTCIIRPCIIAQCVIQQCIACIIRPQCIFECTCGPCIQSPTTFGGGGFGTLGS